MKPLVPAIIASAFVLLVSCQSSFNNMPPPVTEQMARQSGTIATATSLDHGRRIFASRCIECHVLPPISNYPADRWPKIVNWMAPRASLKPEERQAVLTYVLAARAQSR
ncbi:MAG TPA: cytochrome c [Chthoniobacterales bacterium]